MLLEQDDEGDRAKARYPLEEPVAISSEPGMRSLAEPDSSRREILERSLPHGRRWLRKCRDLGRPWNRGEAAFLLVHGQKHYRAQLLARPTSFLPTMFDERITIRA